MILSRFSTRRPEESVPWKSLITPRRRNAMREDGGGSVGGDGHDAVSTHQQAGGDPGGPLTPTHMRVAERKEGGSQVSLSAAPESLASAGPTVLSQIGQGQPAA